MAVYQLGELSPDIAASAWVADSARVIGNVSLGDDASVWFGVVIRGDTERIAIGRGSNIQDNSVVHADAGFPVSVGEGVTVGHQAMLHGCTVGDRSLIGIQAVVMNKAVIGKDCLVGAGAIITEGKVFPDRTLILGAPAKVVRELSDKDVAFLLANAGYYVERQQMYKVKLKRIG
jgi:carbonic anhydrase/acetyltransferase-like protein (isoleucine patch superfamily)